MNLITANYLKHGSPLALLLTNLIKVGQLIHLQIVLMEIYPPVNIQKTMENHIFLIGKPSINGPFSIAMLNYQRVPRAKDYNFVSD